jgi:5-methylcytosine-specific restriction enzyme A
VNSLSNGFVEGAIYNRRADIHARFGGQRQGGIITPADESSPIFLITGAEGSAHGYSDRLRADGVFEYFGEGQHGDMAFVRGNAAVQTHAERGRDLLLFRKHVEGLRFLGQYVYENFHLERAPDTSGTMREVLSEETSLLGLWSLGCRVARIGSTVIALEDSNLCPQI